MPNTAFCLISFSDMFELGTIAMNVIVDKNLNNIFIAITNKLICCLPKFMSNYTVYFLHAQINDVKHVAKLL